MVLDHLLLRKGSNFPIFIVCDLKTYHEESTSFEHFTFQYLCQIIFSKSGYNSIFHPTIVSQCVLGASVIGRWGPCALP